jgi:protein TonB
MIIRTLKYRLLRISIAVLVMMVGGSGVIASMLVMNAAEEPKKEIRQSTAIAFKVKRKRKPPQKKRVVKPRPQPKPRRMPRAPLPVLGVDLSGIDFGIPPIGDEALAGLTDSLLGNADGAMKNLVMTDRAVDQPPKPMQRIKPSYPPRARAKGVTGHVVFKLLIDESGAVEDLKVVEATPEGVFEEAAAEAVRRWRFSPGRYQGKAVRIWSRLKVNFQLG